MDSFIFKSPQEVSLRSRLTVLGGFGLLIVAALAALVIAISAARVEHSAAHSLDVRQAQAQLFSAVQDAETGQRGYLLTGDRTYLEPFEQARQGMPALKGRLAELIADNPDQQARFARMSAAIDSKLDELDRAVGSRKAGDATAAMAIVRTNEGRDIMARIRAQGTALDEAEQELAGTRQAYASRLRTLLSALIIGAVVAAAILALLVTRAARRHAVELIEQNAALLRERKNREQAEAMLRQAQKMEALGQLTGGIAHDFNNMLAIIVGSMDLMLRRLSNGDERLRSLAENALNGANRAAALTKRLLAFSRRQPLDPKPTDINKCVSGMSEMMRRSIGEHIAIETVLAGGLWHGFIDCPQLESALLNLAVNARDAMGESGRLTIETSNAALDRTYTAEYADLEPGQYVLIAVTDTGTGMSPDVLAKAFDPFFTTKSVGEGTGLGLSQVHGFLKQSRGHIKLYSEIGVGTTVKLYLPRYVGTGELLAEIKPEPNATVDRSQYTILIVEDDPGVRSFVVSAARELGFPVIEADSAAVALERLSHHPEISILLTDVVMPGMGGRQLVDTALELRSNLEVIYMTGYTRNAIVHNGILDPGTRLITKPFTMTELELELEDVVADISSDTA
ncbi:MULTISPECIES: CHASE3 domain-containing protein [Sphingobium]|jgi:signal transduction histidine kinase/ActR/RegA family two-component response regulator|uniref:histidine kinase n=2 Tax=Sphingobium TaxID=165695 RepID=A0A5B8CAR6_SPHSA|nr:MULTISPECIES: CHASE3 domain-containing protein [Sphingobium]QDC36564.1 response regulator [Sphingobium fuliginis ATCC 27551]QNG43949.1 CHASE3 domain-containing protein [Sphingobium yanoikuyae]